MILIITVKKLYEIGFDGITVNVIELFRLVSFPGQNTWHKLPHHNLYGEKVNK